MSIKKIKMFTIICDNCKISADEASDHFCWNDENTAIYVALNANYICENLHHYCSKCYSYND